MPPAVAVRPAEAADFAWILALIDRNRADRLTDAQRAGSGFVQGRWDTATLDGLRAGPGMFVAHVDGAPAGVALSTPPGALTAGPAGRTNALAAQRFGPEGFFLYGPVVVAVEFRGMGVLRRLATQLLRHAGRRYPTAVAFIERSNPHSLAVHQHLGWRPFATFEVDERGYTALALRLPPAPEPS